MTIKYKSWEFKDALSLGEFDEMIDKEIENAREADLKNEENQMINIKKNLHSKVDFLNKKRVSGPKFNESTDIKKIREAYNHFLSALMG